MSPQSPTFLGYLADAFPGRKPLVSAGTSSPTPLNRCWPGFIWCISESFVFVIVSRKAFGHGPRCSCR